GRPPPPGRRAGSRGAAGSCPPCPPPPVRRSAPAAGPAPAGSRTRRGPRSPPPSRVPRSTSAPGPPDRPRPSLPAPTPDSWGQRREDWITRTRTRSGHDTRRNGMTRPITAGIDGTEQSLAALNWAAREAVRRGLPLRVVHAWRFETGGDGVDAGDRATQEQWVRDAVGEVARTVRDRHPELALTTDVLEGDAVDTLTAVAADAEMLVLGSRGHGRIM